MCLSPKHSQLGLLRILKVDERAKTIFMTFRNLIGLRTKNRSEIMNMKSTHTCSCCIRSTLKIHYEMNPHKMKKIKNVIDLEQLIAARLTQSLNMEVEFRVGNSRVVLYSIFIHVELSHHKNLF